MPSAPAMPTEEQVRAAYALTNPCTVCPRLCRVDRTAGERGYCRIGAEPVVASAAPHYGEEPPLVGRGGSGTIFLSGCNMLCTFCQNRDISHGLAGRTSSPQAIAAAMLALERCGCENVNLVTPTHVTPWLIDAVRRARLDGLTVPVVYNCGGYEMVETLRLLEGTVQLYMPDAKFLDPRRAERYAGARDYPQRLRAALVEMQRQVGDLRIEGGVATGGLLVRHLVMPGGVEDGKAVMRFLAEQVSPAAHVNVMAQYRPLHRAHEQVEIARPVTGEEWAQVRDCARDLGLNLL